MARRRLTPAQPGYLAPATTPELETKSMPFAPTPGGGIPPIAKVSGQSADAAALRELAEGIETARREGRMVVEVPLADVAPGHLLRDRISLDRDALDELKASIRDHGQRVPADITPLDGTGGEGGDLSPYRFGLISGWRRLRALSELYDETGAPRFSTLRALIRPSGDAADAYVAMIEENEIRVGLSYYERARVIAEVTRRGVFPDQRTALRTLFGTASRAKRSKIASFTEIHDQLGDLLMFPAEISERLGLALVMRLRDGDVPRIRAALAETRAPDAASEVALLERLVRRTPEKAGAKGTKGGEVLAPGVSMTSARKGNRITVSLSGRSVNDALLEKVRRALRDLG